MDPLATPVFLEADQIGATASNRLPQFVKDEFAIEGREALVHVQCQDFHAVLVLSAGAA